jgi:hypothetical protein
MLPLVHSRRSSSANPSTVGISLRRLVRHVHRVVVRAGVRVRVRRGCDRNYRAVSALLRSDLRCGAVYCVCEQRKQAVDAGAGAAIRLRSEFSLSHGIDTGRDGYGGERVSWGEFAATELGRRCDDWVWSFRSVGVWSSAARHFDVLSEW